MLSTGSLWVERDRLRLVKQAPEPEEEELLYYPGGMGLGVAMLGSRTPSLRGSLRGLGLGLGLGGGGAGGQQQQQRRGSGDGEDEGEEDDGGAGGGDEDPPGAPRRTLATIVNLLRRGSGGGSPTATGATTGGAAAADRHHAAGSSSTGVASIFSGLGTHQRRGLLSSIGQSLGRARGGPPSPPQSRAQHHSRSPGHGVTAQHHHHHGYGHGHGQVSAYVL